VGRTPDAANTVTGSGLEDRGQVQKSLTSCQRMINIDQTNLLLTTKYEPFGLKLYLREIFGPKAYSIL
jgi:hypothetical protein